MGDSSETRRKGRVFEGLLPKDMSSAKGCFVLTRRVVDTSLDGLRVGDVMTEDWRVGDCAISKAADDFRGDCFDGEDGRCFDGEEILRVVEADDCRLRGTRIMVVCACGDGERCLCTGGASVNMGCATWSSLRLCIISTGGSTLAAEVCDSLRFFIV